ncbi:MAG: endonuclease/exonuclease/phosphatase family protein [Chitinophagaceae bacterium]
MNSQTVPPVGRSHELEIANWNIEWFGKTSAGFGPGNDSLQQRLVKNILKASDIDVWVLCEVSDTGAFGRLMRQMPEYSSVLASYYPEQKTAILYKNNLYKGIYPQLLGTSNKDSFSTGRFPLKLSLVSLTPSPFDTIDIIALHLKANTGNDSLKNLAYQSRQRSAEWLKDYTYEQLPDKKFIMAGDWNDDLDVSIFNQLPSSLNPLKRNNGNGYFITDRLSAFHIPTTATYPDAIDHQYISNRLYDYYSKDSVFVWRTDQYISNYASTVSDHFPVISRYNQRNYSIAENHKFKGIIYPNPAEKTIRIESKFRIQSVNLIDFSGKTTALINDGGIYNISQFEKGVYLLEIVSEEGVFTEKLSLL